MPVRLNGVMVFRPEDSSVSNAQPVWQRFESGDVLEDGKHHFVELRKCQPRAEFLKCDHDEDRHLLVSERVRRLGIVGVHSIRTVT